MADFELIVADLLVLLNAENVINRQRKRDRNYRLKHACCSVCKSPCKYCEEDKSAQAGVSAEFANKRSSDNSVNTVRHTISLNA